MNKSSRIAALIAISASASMPGAFSQTKAWNVPTTGAWETAGNWNASGVPSTADTVNITNGGTATISSAVSSVYRVNIGGTNLSSLVVNSGGSLSTLGDNLFRIGNGANSIGSVLVDGGAISSARAIYIGVGNNSTATLTLANGGTATSTTNVLMGTADNTGVTATLNIGGDTTATAAGWLSASSVIGGTGVGNVSILRFNHTADRYVFTKSSVSSDAVAINGAIEVRVLSGVTVLTGANNYTRGTTVSNGAVLLANGAGADALSSTGSGTVSVQSSGVLGGIGKVYGATTVAGTLKPGDYDYERSTPTHGVLTFSNSLVLQDGSNTEIAINGLTRGSGYDAINVGGNLTLNGTLTLNLFDGFSIAQDQTLDFSIFQVGGSIFGEYDVFALPDDWNGLSLNWDTSNLTSSGMLSVTAVPEPSSVLLLFGGAAFLLILQRRRSARKQALMGIHRNCAAQVRL